MWTGPTLPILTFYSLFVSQSEMETRFGDLSEKSSHRRQRLLDSNQLFNFFREADEVESWIAEKESIASSDDYGRDLEHVETLLKKFEDFTRDLVTSGERIASLTTQAQTLLDEGHSDGDVSCQLLACDLHCLPDCLFSWLIGCL